MSERDDHARPPTRGEQAQSRAADLRRQTISIVLSSRRCFESSELLLAAEPRRTPPW